MSFYNPKNPALYGNQDTSTRQLSVKKIDDYEK